MNFQRYGSEDETEPALNLTSLIDVMFLLVIFFAVSTTFRIHPGLSVKLPEASSERIAEERKTLQGVLTQDGAIVLDGEPVSRADLLDVLRDKQKVSPVSMFILEADERAMHGQVVELMDAARQVGIPRLAIATRPKTTDPDDE
jgi:biopolymer transport protein ExbD